MQRVCLIHTLGEGAHHFIEGPFLLGILRQPKVVKDGEAWLEE